VTTRYARSATTLWRSVGPESLLTAPGREEVDALSETAAAVWDLLTEPRTLDDLVRRLSERYRAPRGMMEPDVRSLLDQLVARGWVEVDDRDV
jgi:Coenzyme PQQ synthesis protein D (PqqD)